MQQIMFPRLTDCVLCPKNISLPKQLHQLSCWIAKIAHQPAALWWAVRQNALHPSLTDSILHQIEYSPQFSNAEVRIVWHYLFESWKRMGKREQFNFALHGLEKEIQRYGWNKNILQRYSLYTRPYLVAGANFWKNDILPPSQDEKDLRGLEPISKKRRRMIEQASSKNAKKLSA